MHELAVTQDVLNLVLRAAQGGRTTEVKSVTLRIGELRDVVDEWMQRFFDYLSRGTIAEGAQLVIERSPITFVCDCGESLTVGMAELRSDTDIKCPRCGGKRVALSSGREFEILSMEVI
jgi:hydrogenase nickel incorporation protein HypA/HybF